MSKINILTFIIISFFSSSASSQSGSQFNLNCRGEVSIQMGPGAIIKENYNHKYIVDLQNRKYCKDECKEIFSIKEIKENYIEFKNSESQRVDETIIEIDRVDRVSGRQVWTYDSISPLKNRDNLYQRGFGYCFKSEFYGFPKFNRKF
jgi:hypothetical protein